MLIDLTMCITPEMLDDAIKNTPNALIGHLGTHFDVMDKIFPLEYTIRRAVVFDVHNIRGRDIEISDIDVSLVESDMFVAFYTGFSEEEKYGTPKYYKMHPQLSNNLINYLSERGISIISIDCSGIRRGAEHTPTDQRLAERGIFVIENLCGLGVLSERGQRFIAHTYPLKISGITGLPCRVIAEI
jgi:kynurenine formamidase